MIPADSTAPAAGEPPVGHRERKKRETRAALAEAALTLIAERGLDHVTVDEIAATAGVSARTFFNYFPTKEDAVVGFGEEGIARVGQAIRAAPAELSALTAIRLALLAEAVVIAENPTHLILQMQIADRSPALWPRLIAGGENALRDIAAEIGKRLGLDPAETDFPDLLAQVAGSTFRSSVLRWHRSDRTRDLAELINRDFDALQAGLPDPERSGSPTTKIVPDSSRTTPSPT